MWNRLYTVILVLLACRALPADEWPQFRGPAGDGVSDATGVPLQWSATEYVTWKTPIPGKGWSSPVLSRGKLYLTTAVSESETDAVSLRVLCVDAASGRIVWDVEVFRPDPKAAKEVHKKNSLASPTAIVDGERLYVHFGHMGTATLDLQGNILWRQTNLVYKPTHGNGGSPVLLGDVMAFSCDAAENPFVTALDRATGDIRWKTPRNTTATNQFSFSTPTVIEVDGSQQIISPGSGFVGAYDPHDGHEIWRVNYGDGFSVIPRPVYAHGLVFVSTGYSRARLLAINPVNAQGDATEDHVVWSYDKGVSNTPSMVVAGNELYFVADNGVASCLNTLSGEVHWTKRLEGAFSASPIVAEGRIYFLSEEGLAQVVKAATEFELLASNALEERTFASPVPVDNAIFLRSESHLWRIGN